ncbi:MAG TPA: TolC family protein [Nitrospiraceae bacterium]|nr:TolC family protein [Nitrospiraceae bacterium]
MAPTTKGAFLGLKTAIAIAVEQHPLIKKAQETAMAARAFTEQAKAKYYPQLDAYALQTGGTIRPLSGFNIGGAQNKPTSYVSMAGVRADQLIYDFGQTGHRVLAERANREAAEKEILTNKALVILRAQQAYIHCLRLKRVVQIAEETVRERGVIRDQIALLYKRELKSKLDLNFIAVELRNAEVQLLQAKNELRAAFAELNNAMGVQGPEEYTLEDVSVPIPPSSTLESLIQESLEDRPELMSGADRIRAAHENLSSAKALHLPSISATGMYGVIHFSDAPLNQYAGSHDGQTNLWWGAAAVVSVPLFTGFLIENRVAESLQQKYKAEQKQADVANRVALEVTDAYVTMQSAEQQVKVEKQEVESARSALTLAKERYRLGLSSVVDVTTATAALLTAEVRLAEARYGLQASGVALAYATGRGYRDF